MYYFFPNRSRYSFAKTQICYCKTIFSNLKNLFITKYGIGWIIYFLCGFFS